MNDYDAVKIARKIRELNEKASDLAELLREHSNGDQMISWLEENGCLTIASAESCVAMFLENPKKWIIAYGISLHRNTRKNKEIYKDYIELK